MPPRWVVASAAIVAASFLPGQNICRAKHLQTNGFRDIPPLLTGFRVFNYRRNGGVSRAAKGADCKSAGLRLRRFESYLPHQQESVASNQYSENKAAGPDY